MQRACPYAHYNQLPGASIEALHHIAGQLAEKQAAGGGYAAPPPPAHHFDVQHQQALPPLHLVRPASQVAGFSHALSQAEFAASIFMCLSWCALPAAACLTSWCPGPAPAHGQAPTLTLDLALQQMHQAPRILLPGCPPPGCELPPFLQPAAQLPPPPLASPPPAGRAAANGNALAAYKRASGVGSPSGGGGSTTSGSMAAPQQQQRQQAGGKAPQDGGLQQSGESSGHGGGPAGMAGAASLPVLQQGRPALTLQVPPAASSGSCASAVGLSIWRACTSATCSANHDMHTTGLLDCNKPTLL